MPQTAGLNTDAFWGPIRASAVATVASGNPMSEMIAVPPTLADPFTYDEPGAFKVENTALAITRQDLQLTFATAHNAKTAYPYGQFVRGTAGGICTLMQSVRLIAIPDNQEVGVFRRNEYTLAAGAAGHHIQGGMLFDHTIAHAAGVTAPVTSTPVQVGAVSATQSVIVFFGNLHSPAPTWSGAAMQLESDPLATFLVATLRGAAVTGLGSTASYSLQTIAGPITDAWWRLNITTVPSGIGWPVCCMWIVDN